MVARAIVLSVVLAALGPLAACGDVDSCEGRIDLLDSAEGLVLTPEEHPAGWGKSECLQCHPLESIHQEDCTGEDAIDMAAVREEAEDGTYATCAGCHGPNGVEQ